MHWNQGAIGTTGDTLIRYPSQGNLRDANLLMDEMKEQLKSANSEFPKTDLIQFIKYLLPTLERDAYPLFRTPRQKYKTSTDRDPVFQEVLRPAGNVQRKWKLSL